MQGLQFQPKRSWREFNTHELQDLNDPHSFRHILKVFDVNSCPRRFLTSQISAKTFTKGVSDLTDFMFCCQVVTTSKVSRY